MKTVARAKRHPYLALYGLAANGISSVTRSGFSILTKGPSGAIPEAPGLQKVADLDFGNSQIQVAHLQLCKVGCCHIVE